MKRAKRLICLLLTLCMVLGLLPLTALATDSLPFTDVMVTDWYYNEVQFVYENGMMEGTGGNKFSPEIPVTRGMAVAILHRLEGEPVVAAYTFEDVSKNDYFFNAVAWANGNGIINGCGDGKFAPNEPITREQLAAMLYRYTDYSGKDISARADLHRYADCINISSYAKEAMSWAVAEGLISGMNSEILAPSGIATRAQIAAILSRADNLQEESGIGLDLLLSISGKPSEPVKPAEPSTPTETKDIIFVPLEPAFGGSSLLDGYDIWNIMTTTGEAALLAVLSGYDLGREFLYQATIKEVMVQQSGTAYKFLQPVDTIDMIRDYGSGGLDAGVTIYNKFRNYGFSRDSQIPVTIIDSKKGILGTYPLSDCTNMTFHQLLNTNADTLNLRYSLCFIGEDGAIEGADQLTNAKEIVIILTSVTEVAQNYAFLTEKVDKQFEGLTDNENSYIYYNVFAAFVAGSPCYVVLPGPKNVGGNEIAEAGDMIVQYFETYCTDEETGYPVYLSTAYSASFANFSLRADIDKLCGMTIKELFNEIKIHSHANISADTQIYAFSEGSVQLPDAVPVPQWHGYTCDEHTYADFEPFLNDPISSEEPMNEMRLCAAVDTVRIPTGNGGWRPTITNIYLWLEEETDTADPEEENILFAFKDTEDIFRKYEGIPEHYEAAQIVLANGETAYLGVSEGLIDWVNVDEYGINTAVVKKFGTFGQWTGTSDETPLYLAVGPSPVLEAPEANNMHWTERQQKEISIRERIEQAIDLSDLNISLSTYAEDIPVVLFFEGKQIKTLPLNECDMSFRSMFYPDAEKVNIAVTFYTTSYRIQGNFYLGEELTEIWIVLE